MNDIDVIWSHDHYAIIHLGIYCCNQDVVALDNDVLFLGSYCVAARPMVAVGAGSFFYARALLTHLPLPTYPFAAFARTACLHAHACARTHTLHLQQPAWICYTGTVWLSDSFQLISLVKSFL